MEQELRARLRALAEELDRMEQTEGRVEALRAERETLRQEEQRAFWDSERERGDVERLEGRSASALLYAVLGKKQAMLEKEQAEVAEAALRQDAAVRRLNDCNDRLRALLKETAGAAELRRQYSEARAALLEHLRADPARGQRVFGLEKSLGTVRAQLRETREALSVGKSARSQSERVAELLHSAGNWGVWDLVGGGGIITHLEKHGKLDAAQDAALELQRLLDLFRNELADVRIGSEALAQVRVDGFLRFADYFFDGLLADWTVQNRIRSSEQNVSLVRDRLDRAISTLERMYAQLEAAARRLEGELAELLRV